jgi:hypothetical protein
LSFADAIAASFSGARPHVVEDHVHVGAALMCRADSRERRGPLELVTRTVHLPAGARTAEERDEPLQQPARQPLVRAQAGDIRRLVLEAPRILLRCNRAAVEERGVDGADLRFGRDLDVEADARLEVRRIAVERNDRVCVRRAGFCAVVGPLEALDRLAQRREAFA